MTTVTQKKPLEPDAKKRLAARAADYQQVKTDFRSHVLKALEEASFREVSEVTGVSTNTLQRWRKEAQR